MSRALWSLMQFCLCAWMGAASLFVVTGVLEVTSPMFDAVTKNQLAALRFPSFYAFGFGLTGTSAVACAVLVLTTARRTRSLKVLTVLTTGIVILMLVDYVTIFTPLLAMMRRPDSMIDVTFHGLHQQSKSINLVGLLLCCAAVVTAFVTGAPALGSTSSTATSSTATSSTATSSTAASSTAASSTADKGN